MLVRALLASMIRPGVIGADTHAFISMCETGRIAPHNDSGVENREYTNRFITRRYICDFVKKSEHVSSS